MEAQTTAVTSSLCGRRKCVHRLPSWVLLPFEWDVEPDALPRRDLFPEFQRDTAVHCMQRRLFLPQQHNHGAVQPWQLLPDPVNRSIRLPSRQLLQLPIGQGCMRRRIRLPLRVYSQAAVFGWHLLTARCVVPPTSLPNWL